MAKVSKRYRLISERVLQQEMITFDWSVQKWISEVGLSNATVRVLEATDEICRGNVEVIKALEQDPILDKIRAEIAEYKDDKIIHAERNEMIDIVLDIIDKYKAESETQESEE